MDIHAIVTELKRERDRLNTAIAALEDTDSPAAAANPLPVADAPGPPAKTGNRLSPEGRKRLSDALKKRWAEKRMKPAGSAKKSAARR